MFIGEYSHNLDAKGRVAVPSKFRSSLAEGIVVTRGLDRCLWLFPKTQWEALASQIARLPLSQKKSRAFARLMLAGAWDAELDVQGRVVLPDYLRQYANLTKPIVLAGLYTRIELWDADSWATYKQRTEEESDEIAEAMVSLGI